MDGGQSCGQLCHLVSEVCVQHKGDELLQEELERSRSALEQHVVYFRRSKERTSTITSSSTSSSNTTTLSGFVTRLSTYLDVDESIAKNILTNYLASEFRGTKTSLRSLMRTHHLLQPLLQDISHFHHSERLALLQTLKLICTQVFESLVQTDTPQEPHVTVMRTFLYKIKAELKKNIVKALKAFIDEESNGIKDRSKLSTSDLTSESSKNIVAHFRLRELSELLQLLLLLHQVEECDASVRDEEADRFQMLMTLLDLFEKHSFGRRQTSGWDEEFKSMENTLIESIGHLESLVITCLLDLATLTTGRNECGHYLWSNIEKAKMVEKKFLTLGSQSEHGPILLTWMLSNYLSGQAELEHSREFGNAALRLRVMHYLMRTLTNTSLNSCVQGIARGAAYILLTALMASFEIEPMGIAMDVQLLIQNILGQKSIAEDFWRSRSLASHLENLLQGFPAASTRDLSDTLSSLAKAGSDSADQVVFMIRDEQLKSFVENIENVTRNRGQIELLSSDQVMMKNSLRQPYAFDPSIFVDRTCSGDIVDIQGQKFIRWHSIQNASILKILLNQLQSVTNKAGLGASQVDNSAIREVTAITQAFDSIVRNANVWSEPDLDQVFNCVLNLLEKIVRALATPPMELLANCVSILTLRVPKGPREVTNALLQLKLLPVESRGERIINSGLLGSILAEQECYLGEYKLTETFLKLLEELLKCQRLMDEEALMASIKYVTRNLLPSFKHWRYESTTGMEKLGQHVLQVLHSVMAEQTGDELSIKLKLVVCQELMESDANETLISLVLTGDRSVQRLIECQSSWDWGQGTELAHLVHLSMQVLRLLLTQKSVDVKREHFKLLFCSPSTDNSPNFMLIIAQYAYHSHVSKLGVSAIELLTTLAELFPLSLISCLGESAEAIKEILLFRLQSPIEPFKLKSSIIELLTVALSSQPGFTELLLYDDDKELKRPSRIVEAVLNNFECDEDELQLSVMNFFLQLWLNDHKRCISTLRDLTSFWTTITSPLFNCSKPSGGVKIQIMAQTLRLVSLEVFSVEGKVTVGLKARLDSLFDEKCETFRVWWQSVLDDHVLLVAWKAFLIVIVKDLPTLLTPAQCQFVATSLVKSISERLNHFDSENDVQCVLALSEMCLILVRRWQTKCAENMRRWCEAHVTMLERLVPTFEALPCRIQQALLGVAVTALKVSAFKLENEDQVLALWVEPAVGLVLKSLSLTPQQGGDDNALTLSIHLLRTLVTRIGDESLWFGVVHTSCLIQALVSKIHHCLKSRTQPQVSRACLEVLDVLVNRSVSGSKALLSNDLERMLWLPLAEMSDNLPSEWMPTYYFSITLNASLLRLAEYQALDSCITFVALLKEQLTECLMAPRSTLKANHIDLAVVTANLVAELMRFHKQWRLGHPSSESHFFSQMCILIHVCTCLLIRPTFLGMLVAKSSETTTTMDIDTSSATNSFPNRGEELQRIRRMSSSDQEVAATTPETTSIQNSLLDMIGAVVSMLINRSPDFVALINNDMIDLAEYPSLLALGFSSPAFEDQIEGQLVSYGTLVSVANLCIRTMTRSDRSPSPATARVSPASPSPRPKAKLDQMDRRRLLLVLEETLVLLVSQAMLHLGDRRKDEREKHLLRRELGAEIGTIIETGKRYFYRALSKSPQSRGSAASPANAKTAHVPRISKRDEQFIKMVANVVLDVFK